MKTTLDKIVETVLNAIMFIVLGGLFALFMLLGFCSTASAAEPVSDEPTDVIYSYDYIRHVQREYENAQFLTRIANKQIVNDYLWLIDNSDYELCIETWTMFCRSYNLVMKAKRDIRSGFDVDLNTILD